MHLVLTYIRGNMLQLTQRQVSEKLGTSHPTYGAYEIIRAHSPTGIPTKVTLNFLKEYCELFNFNINVMLDICKIGIHIDHKATLLIDAVSTEDFIKLAALFKQLPNSTGE